VLGLLCAAGLGFANHGERFDVRAGLWEVTTSLTSTAEGGDGLGSRAKLSGQKRTYCLTDQDLETGNVLDHISGCSLKVKSSGSKLVVHLKCAAPYGEKSLRVSEFDRIDSETFRGSIRMMGEGGSTQTVSAKWLGGTCKK
jgi:hypothetical protein